LLKINFPKTNNNRAGRRECSFARELSAALGTCISASTLYSKQMKYTQARKHHGGGGDGGGVSSLKKETAVELIVLRAYA